MGKSSGYGWAILASLILHGLLLALLIIGWVPRHKPDLIKPNYIHATLMAETSKSKRATKPAVKPPPAEDKRLDPPREDVAEKQQEEQKKQLEKKREQELKQKQVVEQKKKLELEQKRQQDEEKRKKEEQAKKEETKKEEEKRKQDEKRKQEAAKKAADDKRKREQEIADALEREEAEAQAQADEEANADVQSYSDYIREQMERNWSRPLSARNGMSVELSIQLLRNGQVVSVAVITSSGDAAFDRSAELAVRKVERFDRLQELPESVFSKRFRKFKLIFKAQDLRL
ncbi:MAG: cell envelope integrity protein TolA [Porticoccaceae bacterium]